MKSKKKKIDPCCIEKQCEFQLMGRRCQRQHDICLSSHKFDSRYCEFHHREEYLKDCEYLIYIEHE